MKPNYNAILILEAIAKAPIPDEVKLKAVNDIEKMYADKEYGHSCMVYHEYNLNKIDALFLSTHHIWYKSELGDSFWDRMNKILIS